MDAVGGLKWSRQGTQMVASKISLGGEDHCNGSIKVFLLDVGERQSALAVSCMLRVHTAMASGDADHGSQVE